MSTLSYHFPEFANGTGKRSARPWRFREAHLVNRCNGRRFLDFANQRHPSVRQLHGLMERLLEPFSFGSGWKSEQMQFGVLNESACAGSSVTSVPEVVRSITR